MWVVLELDDRLLLTIREPATVDHRDGELVIAGFASRVLVPVLVGAFCVFYVVVLVATTLRLQGVVH